MLDNPTFMCDIQIYLFLFVYRHRMKISTDGTTDGFGADGPTVEIIHPGRKQKK